MIRGLATMVVLGSLLVGTAALGFDHQPNGFGKVGWGATAESVVSSTPEFKKRYKVKDIRAALETSDVVLTNEGEFLGRRMAVSYVFSGRGLHGVVLGWEDTRPEAFSAWEGVMTDLQALWGPADSVGKDKELIWEGDITRAEARRKRVASGSGVEIRLTALQFNVSAPAGAADLPGKKATPGADKKAPKDGFLEEDKSLFP